MTALSSPQHISVAPGLRDGTGRADTARDHTPRAGGGHRPEIDGLRAVAVLLVAVYHIWFGRVSGGVDVFLLLTGFLITGSLVRVSERGGIRYGAFLGRLAVRLVPTAVLVIAAALAGARLLLPETLWQENAEQALASVLYHLNWQLALDSADYLARDGTTGPFQHFWSLSIQGQFYLLWPLVIGAAVWSATRRASARRGETESGTAQRTASARRGVFATLSAVLLLSLAYSVHITGTDQAWAYFDTGARMWELALGGLLALALPWLNPPRSLRLLLGWAGLAALVLCGVLLQVSTVFPGYAALWPTLAAAAVIMAGTTGSPWGADRVLTLRPVRYLGSISYALYLWHWPVLVFYLTATERTLASPLGGAAVLALSVVLAAVTTPVTDRVTEFGRGGGKLRAPALALACALPLLLTVGTWSVRTEAGQRDLEQQLTDPQRHPGAAALHEGEQGDYPDPVRPDPAHADTDLPATYDDGCNQDTAGTDVIVCEYGAEDSERTVALVGGSHAAHWFPALEELAEDHGWRLLNIVKGACLFTDAPQSYLGEPYTECAEWNDGVMAELADLRPDAVFTTGTTTSLDTSAGYGEEQVVDGYPDRWRQLGELGIEVVAVRDTPRPGFDVTECLSGAGPEECTSEPGNSMADTSPLEVVDLPENVSTLDLTDQFCEPGVCRPVVGNVLVHWDDGHVTAGYMRTLVPALEERLLAATGW